METLAFLRRHASWMLACAGIAAGSCHAQEPVQAARHAASSVFAANLPLRREEAPARSPWLAASGVLLVAAAGGTLLVARRQRWSWLRIAGQARDRAVLQRLSSQALTAQASLHLVRWKGEELLLACTAQQVTLIARRACAGLEEDEP